jgi:hypothetical protein
MSRERWIKILVALVLAAWVLAVAGDFPGLHARWAPTASQMGPAVHVERTSGASVFGSAS